MSSVKRQDNSIFDCSAEGDAAVRLIEQRWFASMSAVRAIQAECAALSEVMELAGNAWRRARIEAARLEAIRDALGEELAARDGLLSTRSGEAGRARITHV